MKTLLHTLIAIVAMVLSSCDHKDLCYVHPHNTKLNVVYDWSIAPDASPAGMCVFFYSVDEPGRYHRFDFPNITGGEIELPAGKYTLITYNNDTEAVQFSGTQSFETHKAFTRTGDLLEPMYGNGVTSSARTNNNERVVITPDGLWGCTATEVNITEHGVSYIHESSGSRADTYDNNGDQTITLQPHDMLCHYSYEVRNVKNAKHISRISGALSGMSGAMTFSGERLDTESITLPVAAHVNGDANTVTGQFLTFGHNENNTAPHKMSFYVEMGDGSKYSFTDAPNLDVTQQVNSAPDRRNVHIIIDGLDLPTPIENGNGYKPSVDDWGVINEDIKI